MPAKTDLAQLNCSLARALGVVGDWWTLLIVRDAFIGARRFGEFQSSLGIARNILADRLDGLVEQGVVAREGAPKRPRYRLTDKGRALLPVLAALMQWGDAWASGGSPPVIITDEEGRPALPIEARSRDHMLDARSVRFAAGPGANARTRAFLDRFARRPIDADT
jgi:DNA-binding HxlR family transcriptional regulator